MNLRIITKNHADDSKIGSLLKIDFKAEWTHESMPTAWELIRLFTPLMLKKSKRFKICHQVKSPGGKTATLKLRIDSVSAGSGPIGGKIKRKSKSDFAFEN